MVPERQLQTVVDQEQAKEDEKQAKKRAKEQAKKIKNVTREWCQTLIQTSQYIGDVYSIRYESARVLIHDHHRQKVGGISSLSFLIATRIKPDEEEIDYTLEDTSIILLRVMDAAQLPTHDEHERIRFQNAQLVSGEPSKHWDAPETMDHLTAQELSFAGVECRVIGTFFLDLNSNDPPDLVPRFGSDLSNYYPNQDLTVYKPNDDALKEIVNYQHPDHSEELENDTRVPIGEVRYASTNRSFQGISNVEVSISPVDLLQQKTALFGMTRTGKSNTTKIIAKSVFDLRHDSEKPLRIGQIIFDPDGEYANENVQDSNSALKNVWKSNNEGKQEDVVTYGISAHPNDPDRKLMLLNFYEDENLQKGKVIINAFLQTVDSIYGQSFLQIEFESPPDDRSALTRYNRRVLAYRALLAKAGFKVPNNFRSSTSGLFNTDLLQAMRDSTSERADEYRSAAAIFEESSPTWARLHTAFSSLDYFISDRNSGYSQFNTEYLRNSSSSQAWADEDFKIILRMIRESNGARLIAGARPQHTISTTADYTVEIYEDLVAGKLVIIDQSSGEPELNESSAERIMRHIFHKNQGEFREDKFPPHILIYIEEAHNLLPQALESDLTDVWVRTAKEGGKYNLGMVCITQEVSSIQKNILKNTANWFIGHLNNKDETRELCKFYDFADFEQSILRAQDRGFLRVKTLSNPFVVPVQIKKFEV